MNSSSKLRCTLASPLGPTIISRRKEPEAWPGLRHSLTIGVAVEQPLTARVTKRVPTMRKSNICFMASIMAPNQRFFKTLFNGPGSWDCIMYDPHLDDKMRLIRRQLHVRSIAQNAQSAPSRPSRAAERAPSLRCDIPDIFHPHDKIFCAFALR